jgi:hypothetical protein
LRYRRFRSPSSASCSPSLIRCIIVSNALYFYTLIEYIRLANHLADYNLSQPISLLTLAATLRYKRREYVFITYPVLGPLFSTIVATRYIIRQAIVGMIHWSDSDIVRYTYTVDYDKGPICIWSGGSSDIHINNPCCCNKGVCLLGILMT